VTRSGAPLVRPRLCADRPVPIRPVLDRLVFPGLGRLIRPGPVLGRLVRPRAVLGWAVRPRAALGRAVRVGSPHRLLGFCGSARGGLGGLDGRGKVRRVVLVTGRGGGERSGALRVAERMVVGHGLLRLPPWLGRPMIARGPHLVPGVGQVRRLGVAGGMTPGPARLLVGLGLLVRLGELLAARVQREGAPVAARFPETLRLREAPRLRDAGGLAKTFPAGGVGVRRPVRLRAGLPPLRAVGLQGPLCVGGGPGVDR
jgi:hypothetical protein